MEVVGGGDGSGSNISSPHVILLALHVITIKYRNTLSTICSVSEFKRGKTTITARAGMWRGRRIRATTTLGTWGPTRGPPFPLLFVHHCRRRRWGLGVPPVGPPPLSSSSTTAATTTYPPHQGLLRRRCPLRHCRLRQQSS